jgi:hypothetical protein
VEVVVKRLVETEEVEEGRRACRRERRSERTGGRERRSSTRNLLLLLSVLASMRAVLNRTKRNSGSRTSLEGRTLLDERERSNPRPAKGLDDRRTAASVAVPKHRRSKLVDKADWSEGNWMENFDREVARREKSVVAVGSSRARVEEELERKDRESIE